MATERIDIVVSSQGVKVVQRDIQQVGQTATKSATQVDFLKQALAGLAVGASVTWFVKQLDGMTNLQNKLRATGAESTNLSMVWKELLNVSNQTRTSMDGTVTMYARLAQNSKELGVSQQELIGFTKSLNQAVILSGATSVEAKMAMIQLSQGMASGKLAGDELRAVLEQLPIVADVISQKLGVTRGEIRKLGAQGKITGQVILQAFKEASDSLNERFQRMTPTIGQAFTVLENQWQNWLLEFDRANGLVGMLSRAILWLGNNLDEVIKTAVSLGAALTVFYALPAIVNKVGATLAALGSTNPYLALAAVLAAVVTYLALMKDEILLGIDATTTLGDLFRGLGDFMAEAYDSAGDFFSQLGSDIVDLSSEMIGSIGEVFSEFANGFGQTSREMDGFREVSSEFWAGMRQSVGDSVGQWASEFSSFFQNCGSGWVGLAKGIARVIDFIAGIITGTLLFIGRAFAGIGDILKNAFNAAYNAIASIIENIVNITIAGMNELRGLIGKEAIEAIKIQRLEVNEKVFEEFGTSLANAVQDGFEIQGGYVEKSIDELLVKARQHSEVRAAAEAADRSKEWGVNMTSHGKAKVPEGKEDKHLDRLKRQLDHLLSSYNRVKAAEIEYNKAVAITQHALAHGLIPTEEKRQEILAEIRDHLQDQRDPMGALNREMDKEEASLKLLSQQRTIEVQLHEKLNDLKQKGINLAKNPDEVNALRQRIAYMEHLKKLSEARDRVYEGVTGPKKEFTYQVNAVKELRDRGEENGGISKEQANAYMVDQNPDLFAGTQEALDAQVTRYKDAYAQIDQLRQADLISEQTAAQMKYRADTEQLEARLSATSSIMGNLANLQKSKVKEVAKVGKAAALVQAIIDSRVAIQKALTGAPPPWNYAMAAAVGAASAVNIAAIASQNVNGFRTGGSFVVGGAGGPDSQMVAFRATPGEKVAVSTPQQVKKGDQDQDKKKAAKDTPSFRIVNVIDPSEALAAMETSAGEQIVLNVIQRNPGVLRRLLGGPS